MNRPLFSIIITTHERSNLLSRALQSLINQSFQNFEIILISDCFDIGTIEIAKTHLRKSDSFVMNPNLIGPAESRNLGIELSKGKWITFLDDDDAYSNDYLKEIDSSFFANKSDVYYCNYIKVKEDLDKSELIEGHQYNIKNIDIKSLQISNFIPNSCIILNSHLARLVKFDSTLESHEDWDWLIQLSNNSEFQHIDITGPIIYENISNSRNLESHKTKDVAFDFLTIYRKWRSKDKETKSLRRNCLMNMGLTIDESFL